MSFKISSTVLNRGSHTKIEFNITNIYDSNKRPTGKLETFKKIYIDDVAEVWFQFSQTLPPNYTDTFGPDNAVSLKIAIQFLNNSIPAIDEGKNTVVTIHVKCKILNYSEQFNCTEFYQDMGKMTGKSDGTQYKLEPFDVDIIVSKREIISFAKLYYDTDFTDFQLSTSEGSVSVHRVCLAAHSDLFKTMLIHEWKETAEGSIKVNGVTLETLCNLKNYIYLNRLPENEESLRALLILASYYLMDVLVLDCVTKLAQMVTSENLQSLLEYACANNIPQLTYMIIEQTPSDVVHNAQLIRKLEIRGDSKEDLSNNQSEDDK